MRNTVTVAIVTRNRAADLDMCLSSLLKQTIIPPRILIVDNASTDNTREVIRRHSVNLSIRVINEHKKGYAAVYNRALTETKTSWIAFIDDDCVAKDTWYESTLHAVEQYPQHSAISGASLNYYRENIYACAFQFQYAYWQKKARDKKNILDYRSLDSRNIMYNKKRLLHYHIKFDTTFAFGAEDGDLGLQLQKKQLLAIHSDSMIVYHKEPTMAISYIRKKMQQSRAFRQLYMKWNAIECTHPSTKLTTRQTLKIFLTATAKLSLIGKFVVMNLAIIDHVYTRIFSSYVRRFGK